MAFEIWHDRLTANTISATEEATDWPASHLGLTDFERAWRSTTTGAVTVTISFSSAQDIKCLQLQRPNFESATVRDAGGNSLGAINTVTDDHGIARAFLELDVLTDTLTLEIPAGGAIGGAAYWSIGTAWIMGTKTTLDVAGFLEPLTDVSIEPGETDELPGGRLEATILGPKFVEWREAQVRARDSDDVRQLHRLARAGPVVIRPWDEDKITMPVRNYRLEQERTWSRATRHGLATTYREI